MGYDRPTLKGRIAMIKIVFERRYIQGGNR
jgi:hypothetical protein